MTENAENPLSHSTFTIERELNAAPGKVFTAFADPDVKAKWFVGPDAWRQISSGLDFREGGREHNEGQFGEGGPTSRFDAYYFEIVPDARIVYSYEMRVNGERLSVSLASIELTPSGTGTRLTLTEQGVYYMPDDAANREQGTNDLMDALQALVDG
jgi:uncharacterized protein YndB with AHSA1/START domain